MELQTGLGKVKDLTPSVWDIVKWDRDCGDKFSMRKEGHTHCTLLLQVAAGLIFWGNSHAYRYQGFQSALGMLHTQADIQAQVSIYPVLRGSLKQ